MLAQNQGQFKKAIEDASKQALKKSMPRLEAVLTKHIWDDWYNRPSYEGDSQGTDSYERTFQLIKSATHDMTLDGYEGHLFIDATKLTPYFNPKRSFNSYMDLNNQISSNGKSYGEWVAEWIEAGNKWMEGGEVYTKTEKDIRDNNLTEKEMIIALKSMGIEAEII